MLVRDADAGRWIQGNLDPHNRANLWSKHAEFDVIVREYLACIARHSLRVVDDPDLARNLTQDTFVNAFLIDEAIHATLSPKPTAYPLMPWRWPLTPSADNSVAKGGADHQANVQSYRGLPAS